MNSHLSMHDMLRLIFYHRWRVWNWQNLPNSSHSFFNTSSYAHPPIISFIYENHLISLAFWLKSLSRAVIFKTWKYTCHYLLMNRMPTFDMIYVKNDYMIVLILYHGYFVSHKRCTFERDRVPRNFIRSPLMQILEVTFWLHLDLDRCGYSSRIRD